MKAPVIAVAALCAGCAATEPAKKPGQETATYRLPAAQVPQANCQPMLDQVNAQLAAEVAERQRIVRAAARREETLRKQLDAMKAIERGILEREERTQTQAR